MTLGLWESAARLWIITISKDNNIYSFMDLKKKYKKKKQSPNIKYLWELLEPEDRRGVWVLKIFFDGFDGVCGIKYGTLDPYLRFVLSYKRLILFFPLFQTTFVKWDPPPKILPIWNSFFKN